MSRRDVASLCSSSTRPARPKRGGIVDEVVAVATGVGGQFDDAANEVCLDALVSKSSGNDEQLTAHHLEGGAGLFELSGALWPERAPRGATFNNLVSLARRQLGSAADGTLHLPHAEGRRYRVGPGVVSDWELLVQAR